VYDPEQILGIELGAPYDSPGGTWDSSVGEVRVKVRERGPHAHHTRGRLIIRATEPYSRPSRA
jgi:hypothetical protein